MNVTRFVYSTVAGLFAATMIVLASLCILQARENPWWYIGAVFFSVLFWAALDLHAFVKRDRAP